MADRDRLSRLDGNLDAWTRRGYLRRALEGRRRLRTLSVIGNSPRKTRLGDALQLLQPESTESFLVVGEGVLSDDVGVRLEENRLGSGAGEV